MKYARPPPPPVFNPNIRQSICATPNFSNPGSALDAEDLVLIMDTLEECISMLKVWKAGMESKGLYVTTKKTKFLVSGVGLDFLKKSIKYHVVLMMSATAESVKTSSSTRNASYGSTTGAVVDWWPTQFMSAPNVAARLGQSMADQLLKLMWAPLSATWVIWVAPVGLWQCHCC